MKNLRILLIASALGLIMASAVGTYLNRKAEEISPAPMTEREIMQKRLEDQAIAFARDRLTRMRTKVVESKISAVETRLYRVGFGPRTRTIYYLVAADGSECEVPFVDWHTINSGDSWEGDWRFK